MTSHADGEDPLEGRIAELLQAHEDGKTGAMLSALLAALVRAEVRAEREACAALVAGYPHFNDFAADAIRARGEVPK